MSIQNSGLNYIVYITLDTRTDHTKSVLSRMIAAVLWVWSGHPCIDSATNSSAHH